MYTNLEDVIRHHIHLSTRRNGWFSVLCKICNDHGRKGKRAGFNFDGPKVGYNCFNCGHAAVYDPTTHPGMSKEMKEVLDAFGVPKDDWQQVVFTAYAHQGETKKVSHPNQDIEPAELPLPDYFYRLTNDPNDEWAVCANEHLAEKRSLTCDDYPFYLAKRTENPESKRWYGRLIIPVYKGEKLVFYQGRDLAETRPNKYLSPDTQRENVIYGYEYLFEDTEAPLYIVEGFFDAFLLKGVAVFGKKITPNQIRWINQSRRPKVVIPDAYGTDSIQFAEQALSLGWAVATPDIGSCKDISDAVIKYGLLYTLRTVKEHTNTGFEAAVKAKLYCKNDT
jgi:hypothetical protein